MKESWVRLFDILLLLLVIRFDVVWCDGWMDESELASERASECGDFVS